MLICKTLPQTDLWCEQYTSRLCDPAIAWHAPHGADQRQRQQHQLHGWNIAVLLAPTGIDGSDPWLAWIIHTQIGHHDLLSPLNPYHIVKYPDLHRVAHQTVVMKWTRPYADRLR